jgi:hypothetical protein
MIDVPGNCAVHGGRAVVRRNLVALFLALASVTTCATLAGCSDDDKAANGALTFPKDVYTVQSKKVSTSDGERTVTYHLYRSITYVTNPVDADYQSLDVSVPVKVDDSSVDASGAPILLEITVGGYMSSRNKASASAGGSTGSGSPGGTMLSGGPGGVTPSGGAQPSGSGTSGVTGANPAGSGTSANSDLALAAGFVVVTPGLRGRDNVTADGKYYGKAPAAIVDLKAAVRYVHANKGVIPGDTDRIVSTGRSAGGALSALLGASGDSSLYDSYLDELGAAHASDAIYAAAAYCPITDLEHADTAYEWMFGTTPRGSRLVDQAVSQKLKETFARYQASLKLQGTINFGTITAENYGEYLLKTYLQPAATTFLAALSDADRAAYLAKNPWINWSGSAAAFSLASFVSHIGRSKGVPAFDDFELSRAEPNLFGNDRTNARHFTNFSLQHTSGNSLAQIDIDLPEKINMMNPMYFLGQKNAGRAKHWWLRVGTSDTETSPTILPNLAAAAANADGRVNALMYWDAGHDANEDPGDFIAWIRTITGFTSN